MRPPPGLSWTQEGSGEEAVLEQMLEGHACVHHPRREPSILDSVTPEWVWFHAALCLTALFLVIATKLKCGVQGRICGPVGTVDSGNPGTVEIAVVGRGRKDVCSHIFFYIFRSCFIILRK